MFAGETSELQSLDLKGKHIFTKELYFIDKYWNKYFILYIFSQKQISLQVVYLLKFISFVQKSVSGL